jgi:hypothetical protein
MGFSGEVISLLDRCWRRFMRGAFGNGDERNLIVRRGMIIGAVESRFTRVGRRCVLSASGRRAKAWSDIDESHFPGGPTVSAGGHQKIPGGSLWTDADRSGDQGCKRAHFRFDASGLGVR